MRISVELQPRREYPAADVALVVDVLRATTTVCVLLEGGGVPWVGLAETVALARELAPPGAWRAGEIGGLAPPGFDLGNSPAECASWQFAGRPVVLATTNGTLAVHRCYTEMGSLGLACLRNLQAAAAWALASGGEQISVICAGRLGGVGADDVYVAGRLVEAILALEPDCWLDDGAVVARASARDLGAPQQAFSHSAAGISLARAGFEADLELAAQLNISEVVPKLVRRAGQLLIFTSEGPG